MRDRDLTPSQRLLLDRLVAHGSVPALVAHLGCEHRHISVACTRICEKVGMPLFHLLIAWAEHRKIETPRLPPAHPFDLTDKQRRAWELRMQDLTHAQIGEAMGCNDKAAFELVKAARSKIPGEREGQKQAAWRRACTPGT